MTTTEPTTPTNSLAEEQHENYYDKRKKTIHNLKQALFAIFMISSVGAWQQAKQQVHYVSGTEITYKMMGAMTAWVLFWGIGELWVLSRKSRLGAVILFIIAILNFLSTAGIAIEQHLEINIVLVGVPLLISIYIIAITSKLRRLEIAEKAYWDSWKSSETAVKLEQQRTAIKANDAELFSSPLQVTLGNRSGDVTLVEFFDYNCLGGKRAVLDLLALMKGDPKLKVVLKEFPTRGPGSVEAACVAVAVRMQDAGGARYLEFHRKLLENPGQNDKARAFAAAQEAGLDMARLERDMASDEVEKSIDETSRLAKALGIRGTLCYVVGEHVIHEFIHPLGRALGLTREALKYRIAAARNQRHNSWQIWLLRKAEAL